MLKSLLLCLCFVLIKSDVTEFSWKENDKLTWQDFQGKPNLDSDAVAMTASGITFSYSIKKTSTRVISFEAIVEAYFYPEHSWCKKGEVDNHVLSHEQLHFDITELNSRLLRQKISTIKPSKNTVSLLDKYHKEANTNLAAMQNKYDTESDYSINKEEQAKWQLHIEKELKRLYKFRSRP